MVKYGTKIQRSIYKDLQHSLCANQHIEFNPFTPKAIWIDGYLEHELLLKLLGKYHVTMTKHGKLLVEAKSISSCCNTLVVVKEVGL